MINVISCLTISFTQKQGDVGCAVVGDGSKSSSFNENGGVVQ